MANLKPWVIPPLSEVNVTFHALSNIVKLKVSKQLLESKKGNEPTNGNKQ